MDQFSGCGSNSMLWCLLLSGVSVLIYLVLGLESFIMSCTLHFPFSFLLQIGCCGAQASAPVPGPQYLLLAPKPTTPKPTQSRSSGGQCQAPCPQSCAPLGCSSSCCQATMQQPMMQQPMMQQPMMQQPMMPPMMPQMQMPQMSGCSSYCNQASQSMGCQRRCPSQCCRRN